MVKARHSNVEELHLHIAILMAHGFRSGTCPLILEYFYRVDKKTA